MLECNFVINHIKVDTIQRSDDGTIKNAVRLRWFSGGVCLILIQEQLPAFPVKWVVV
jgi:hypothetical protein